MKRKELNLKDNLTKRNQTDNRAGKKKDVIPHDDLEPKEKRKRKSTTGNALKSPSDTMLYMPAFKRLTPPVVCPTGHVANKGGAGAEPNDVTGQIIIFIEGIRLQSSPGDMGVESGPRAQPGESMEQANNGEEESGRRI